MMESSLTYWIFEYIKVFLVYGFVLFVWPSVVFRKYLKTKSITFRFCFCATVQIIIINSVVLLLGLFHLLNKFTMCLFFFGIFLWSLREFYVLNEDRKKRIKYVMTGTMGWKHLLLTWFEGIRKSSRNHIKVFKKFYKKHFGEYSLLILLLLYGMLYFSYGAFRDFSYGFGDLYVHHSWIYGLIQGQIFSDGVYPEAMHCIVYTMHTLFGVRVYSILLFLAGIHVAVILLAAYCLMKEIFHWRFSAIFVLVMFLIVDVICIDEVFSMSRLQWTLPQEYAFHTMYICALYLILYLKNYKKTVFLDVELKACWDENLFLFMMALAASIAIHFYVTIMAFFLCFSFAIFKLKSIFNKKHFVPLVVAVITGLMIAFVPMGGALLSGIPFQGSIGWAVNVINGMDRGEGRAQYVQTENDIDTSDDIQNNETSVVPDEEALINQNAYNENGNENEFFGEININSEQVKENLIVKIIAKIKFIGNAVVDKLKGVYTYGYNTLYAGERAQWIVGFSFLSTILYFLYRLIWFIRFRLLKKSRNNDDIFSGYLPIILASFLIMFIYAAPLIGLPELIAGSRLCTTGQMLILMVIIMPFDMLFSLLRINMRDDTLEIWSIITTVAMVLVICFTGSYHGYLYYELTRYNAAVSVTNEIIASLPDNTYTIVSTTDEIYQVIQNGRHEEVVTFLLNQNKDYYTIPTEYLFVFVEKKPIKYAHNHFFAGPKWLALEKYHEMYRDNYSCCEDVLSAMISEEYVTESIRYFNKPSEVYSILESRTILESKMYYWCQKFAEMYPNEIQQYYEDDNFVCYYIKQNPQFLYNLVLK